MGGATQSNAALYKNDAAIRKTEAANQWNYYQAKSGKQNLAELAVELVDGEKRARFEKDIERYKTEKAEIKSKAEEFEKQSKAFDELSEAQMHQHHRWAQATTALQISIALAAIALLTRRQWLLWGVVGVSGVGLALGALAALHI